MTSEHDWAEVDSLWLWEMLISDSNYGLERIVSEKERLQIPTGEDETTRHDANRGEVHHDMQRTLVSEKERVQIPTGEDETARHDAES